MNIDKLLQQEERPSMRRLREMLHLIQPPEKTQSEWSTLESDLIYNLARPKKQRIDAGTNVFNSLFKPYALVPGFVAAIFVIAVSIGIFTHEKPTVPSSHVADVRGRVLVRTHAQSVCDTLRGNSAFGASLPIAKGLSFTTLDSSTLIVQFREGCAMTLSPNSNLTIKELGAKHMIFGLARGAVLAKMTNRAKNRKFEVITPSAICEITGTIFKVEALVQGDHSTLQTILTVYEGNVLFAPLNTSREPRQLVAAGQRCASEPGSVPYYYVSEFETPIKAISTLELLVNSKYSTAQASGLVDVASRPEEALVMIDDTIVGKTPLVLRKPIGNHKIMVTAPGYSHWERQFKVGRDSISSLTAALAALTPSAGIGRNATMARKLKRKTLHMMPSDPESLLVAFPEYAEANIQLSIGEYQKALGILDSLKNNYPLDLRYRRSIMIKINSCYAKLGDFTAALAGLQEKIDSASASSAHREKERLLWEMANLNANCIGDYNEAELALIELLAVNPAGNLIREAYEKLAEIQYMLCKYDGVVATYKTFLKKFPGDPARERVLFSLAGVLDNDLNRFKEAIGLYTKVMDDFPRGRFYKAALFARGECFDKLGRMIDAKSDYKKYRRLDPQGIWIAACAKRLKAIR